MKQKSNIAYWDRSFLEEVEGKTIYKGILLWAFSGAAFAIRTPQAMIYLDTYLGGEPVEFPAGMHRSTAIAIDPSQIKVADAALVTHEHYDHCHEETMQAMAKSSNVHFYGPASVIKECSSYNLPVDRVHQLKPGDRFEIKDTVITLYPGYDENAPGAVTYTIETGGIKVFFGGDSASGQVFEEIGASGGVDIAMLAFGRTWYMSEEQMFDAAETLHPRLLIPFHWELWRGHTGDVLKLGRLVERRKLPFDVQLLLIGDYLHYLPDGKYEKGPQLTG